MRNNMKRLFAIFFAICVVLSGAAPMSVLAETEHSITKQPTATNPTVEVSDEEGVSYQWYNTKEQVYNVIDKDTDAGTYEINVIDVGPNTSYDATGNVWQGSDFVYLSIELNVGDTLIITPTEGFEEGDVVEVYGTSVKKSDSGTYTYTAGYSDIYGFYVGAEIVPAAANDDSSGLVKAKFQVQRYSTTDAIKGETSAVLSEGEYNKAYICEVSWEDGTIITSNAVILTGAIKRQPTTEKTEVLVDFPEEVKSYQWYETEVQTLDVVYHGGQVKDNVLYANEAHDGSSKDGAWQSKEGVIALTCSVEAGDVIKVSPANEEDSVTYDLHGNSENGFYTDDGNGNYIFTTESDSDDFYLQFCSSDEEFSLLITITKVDGTKYTIESYNPDENKEIEVTLAYGTYQDGMWNSSSEYEFVDHCIWFELDLKEGDLLTLDLSDGFIGEVAWGDYDTYEMGFITEENGIYSFSATKDGSFDIMMISEEEAFSCESIVTRTVFGDAIEGQTSATLTPEESGTYACVVTFKDGTILVSNNVEVIVEEEQPTETPPADNQQGGTNQPDNTNNNVPNTGDTTSMIPYLALMLLGAGVILVESKKRNFVR